ncbi:hypothetical protein PPACK8108_LOCUS12182 [Phakopsora pachyrhizi]|uniref:Ras-associating domain-containing protein n=1 Tax=Phakopsora pachyrhizi TaxID=170000 RepID=A0AAV0B3F4_PHAPC|nr:hypothetical protein PPACK8108_LOCUS12182 [Phakopsora pachyrhizi]
MPPLTPQDLKPDWDWINPKVTIPTSAKVNPHLPFAPEARKVYKAGFRTEDEDEDAEGKGRLESIRTSTDIPIDRLIEIRDQRIHHLETKIHSIKLNSSSASSLLTSSNSTSPSIFESQLASSNPRYGRHLREQSINQLVIPDNQSIPRTFSPINTIHSITYFICYYYAEEPIIKTSTVSSPTSASSATTTPHETSFVSNQTTSTPTLKDSSRTTTTSSRTASNLSKDDDQSNPCKSFIVTLEDPCYKVLLAALKKYKIKEHYKNYVLFICYGNQERCLSYKDKLLLLFQRLREDYQNPDN